MTPQILQWPALIVGLVLLMLIPTASMAVVILDDNQTHLTTPISDDVFATGGTIVIDAPVDSLVVAGGMIQVNAPVKGDLIAAGGKVSINANVGGKVIAAGGSVVMNGSVGTNLIAAGGKVNVMNATTVSRDALLSGGSVTNAGNINGTLRVGSSNFQNTGTAGSMVIDSPQDHKEANQTGDRSKDHGNWSWISAVLALLMALGFLIIGLVLIVLFPGAATAVGGSVLNHPVRTLIFGIGGLIGGGIICLLLLISIVGIPLALLVALLIMATTTLSGLVTSLALGKFLGDVLKMTASPLILFIIGFVLLNLLQLIPILGGIIWLIALLLGTGAIFSAAFELIQNRDVPA
ncbi:hypothetical protein [Methanosphaerula palustris]|uniref:DUF8173 domain-containing protein n=1 Tax=Methanosphaerula palustris (strain ATCC BAA-1556 / DSM 19958 / E1-9c) TaxID=521011 RepID=B8GHI6_METPE|nr:hypothetical protein [Methanosphaerula palustris]ACL16591.1 conserved hypothetical protein [Methanosphaerula palustris E1-9c]